MPHGIKVNGKGKKSYVLKLENNLYGVKEVGKLWHDHLTIKLKSIGFIPSKWDPCLYYRSNVIFFFYVDDGIFISKNPQDVETDIADLVNTGPDLEDRGSIADYLGVNIVTTRTDLILRHSYIWSINALEILGWIKSSIYRPLPLSPPTSCSKTKK